MNLVKVWRGLELVICMLIILMSISFIYFGGIILGAYFTESITWASVASVCAFVNALNAYDFSMDFIKILKLFKKGE